MDLSGVRQERQRFFDGGNATTPYDEGAPPRLVLDREPTTPPQRFRLTRRIGYRDRWLGILLVPADPARFETDLTTVPALFTWLVPKDGTHLLAAVIHDGLFTGPGQPVSYVSVEGHRVDRVQANRVFRDAMADGGTRVVRRWLMWSAVQHGDHAARPRHALVGRDSVALPAGRRWHGADHRPARSRGHPRPVRRARPGHPLDA